MQLNVCLVKLQTYQNELSYGRLPIINNSVDETTLDRVAFLR